MKNNLSNVSCLVLSDMSPIKIEFNLDDYSDYIINNIDDLINLLQDSSLIGKDIFIAFSNYVFRTFNYDINDILYKDEFFEKFLEKSFIEKKEIIDKFIQKYEIDEFKNIIKNIEENKPSYIITTKGLKSESLFDLLKHEMNTVETELNLNNVILTKIYK